VNCSTMKNNKRKSNHEIVACIYFFSALFFAMIAYMVYFVGFRAADLMGNPYNARTEVFNDQFIRGNILSSDGQILAKTEITENKDQDGNATTIEKRVYPFGEVFAQAVGYSTKGKTGIESLTNFYLMKSSANPVARVANELTETKSPGDNVTISLDAGLQQTAYEALGDHAGAVIAMDPMTGYILCMVSKPSFDPNTIVDAWDAIVNDPNQNGELLNRCTQGLYAPGSTFKIFMTLAYLREHGDDPSGFQFNCTGAYQDPSDDKYIVHCFDGEVHGQEDLSEAFANSCNAAFSEMGTTIDRTELRKLCDSMYFNEDLPIALTKSRSRFTVDATTDTWTMMQTAIGQGNTMMSPLHSVLITAAIANGGISMEPQLLMQITSSDGEIVRTFNWQDGNRKTLMNQEEASVLASYMRKVVTDGTASRLRDASYEAAGKTGSAEVTKDGITKTNAWFTGFAPYSSPRIAVCVVVEDGETGGRTAVPIAKKVMDYWIQKGQ